MKKILTHSNYHIHQTTWICIYILSLLLLWVDCLCSQYQRLHSYSSWIYRLLLIQRYSFRNSTLLSYTINIPYAPGLLPSAHQKAVICSLFKKKKK